MDQVGYGSIVPTAAEQPEAAVPEQASCPVRAFELARIALCASGIYFGYAARYELFAGLVVFSLAGLTGTESLLFGDESARSKGWQAGSPYQVQSALNNLSAAVAFALLLRAGAPSAALAAVALVVIIFICLSGLNHLVSYLNPGNASGTRGRSIHLWRALGALLLGGSCVPILLAWGALGPARH